MTRRAQEHFIMAVTALMVTLAALLIWFATPAKAQRSTTVVTCGTFTGQAPAVGSAGIMSYDQNGNQCVAGSIATSIAGFAPAGTFATLTATGSSASVALPAGAVVVFQNTGTTAVSCTLGVGSATAVVSQNIVQPGSWAAYTVGSNTFGACIDQTGSASNVVVLSGGTGIPTGAGGGSSGSGTATYNATPPALSDGATNGFQLSASGSERIMAGANWGANTTWNTGTVVNTNLVLMCGDGAQSVTVDLQDTGTVGGGQITFQFSNDATDCSGTTGAWASLPTSNIIDQYTLAAASANPWIAANGQQKYTILPNGARAIRARLTTVLTGAGHQVIISPTVIPANTAISGILGPISPGSAVIGGVTFSQSSPGITNGVVNNPTSASVSALTHVPCGSTSYSCVLKNSAGNFYGAYGVCASLCYLMVFNSVSAPSNGATTTGTAANNLVDCIAIPAGDQRSLTYPVFPVAMSTGITAVLSSTSCGTLTIVTTGLGFIHGTVQ